MTVGGETTDDDETSYTGTLPDASVNFTADFGFWPPKVAIGNFVWEDTNNDGDFDAGETPIDGVVVQLFEDGDNPLTDTPVASTSTAGGGFYEFDQLDPGSYFVFIPPSEFGSGEPLEGYISSAGNGADETTDQTGDENGIDDNDPATNGISSTVYDLQPDSEVTGEDQSSYTGTLDDDNVNFTADLGFYTEYDLALIKELAPGQPAVVNLGDPINYVLTVKNQGTVNSGEFTVEDTVPAGMIATSVTGFGFSDCQILNAGTLVRCVHTSDLAPGATSTINLTLLVTDASQTAFRNWAEITEDSGDDNDSTPDTNTGSDNGPGTGTPPNDEVDNHNDIDLDEPPNDEDDNDYEDVSVVIEYDLALIKELADGQSSVVGLGDSVNYVLTVKNQGNVNSGAFTVEDTVPAGMIATSVSGQFDDCQILNAGTLVRCERTTDLAPGATATIDLTLLVTDASQTAFRNWAEITEDSGDDNDSTPDTNTGSDNGPGTGTPPNDEVDNHNDIDLDEPPNDEDDNDYEDVSVVIEYDLALIKELAPGQPSVVGLGDSVDYVLTVKNQGNVNSGAFTVEDTVPAGMIATSVSGQFDDCQILNAGTLVRCERTTDLAPGANGYH